MAVFDMVVKGGIPRGFDSVGIVAVPFLVKESVDFFKVHGLVVAHSVVGDDVAGAEVV